MKRDVKYHVEQINKLAANRFKKWGLAGYLFRYVKVLVDSKNTYHRHDKYSALKQSHITNKIHKTNSLTAICDENIIIDYKYNHYCFSVYIWVYE